MELAFAFNNIARCEEMSLQRHFRLLATLTKSECSLIRKTQWSRMSWLRASSLLSRRMNSLKAIPSLASMTRTNQAATRFREVLAADYAN